MKTVFGWWDWDAETPALVNRVTGERVAYRGRFHDTDIVSPDESWLRFDYLHPELEFPLLVEECQAGKTDKRDKGKVVWRLDYRRSAALWSRETESKSAFPAYGVWRRVDDCATDALACWPADEGSGKDWASYVLLDGGWLNSAWTEAISRQESRLDIPKRTVPNSHDYNSWLVPLEASAPSPFQFHDLVPQGNGSEAWEIDNPVLLDELRFEDPKFRYGPTLPIGASLTNLEGRTAYLLSNDGERLLYPYFGDVERPSGLAHWQPHFSMIYVDSDLLLTGNANPRGIRRPRSDWGIGFYQEGFYFRSDPVDPAFSVKTRHPFPPFPSRHLWLRARWALIDGWSCWKGSKARCPEWLPGLELAAASGIRVVSGYRGGHWVGSPSVVARF